MPTEKEAEYSVHPIVPDVFGFVSLETPLTHAHHGSFAQAPFELARIVIVIVAFP